MTSLKRETDKRSLKKKVLFPTWKDVEDNSFEIALGDVDKPYLL